MNLDQQYWNNRYKNGSTGWDIGYPSPPLTTYCQTIQDKSSRILIPGAGNAYEFDFLLKEGFNNVFVIDISESAIELIIERNHSIPQAHLFCENFFDHEGTYDLILEQTFFCALEPGLRQKYVQKCHDLLLPGGKIAGVLFDFPLTDQGPPFGGSAEVYTKYFQQYFDISILERCYNSIPPRAGNELFIEAIKTQVRY